LTEPADPAGPEPVPDAGPPGPEPVPGAGPPSPDPVPAPDPMGHFFEPLARIWRALATAITFLTVVPLPSRKPAPGQIAATPTLTASLAWFPLVGAACGALAGAVRLGAGSLFGRGPGTVLAIAALVIVTGALHQDGLADSLDGLGVRGDRERRLRVMRDSSTGVFGVLGLIGYAVLLYTSLSVMDGDHAFRTLLAAGAASRISVLLHALGADPARREGLGTGFSVPLGGLVFAAACTAAVVLLAAGSVHGLLVLGVTMALAGVWTLFTGRAYGGRTGDTLGAAVALTEIAVCLTLSAYWHP
jgi:adenosylcobinamide-GDP ribazoletransferase